MIGPKHATRSTTLKHLICYTQIMVSHICTHSSSELQPVWKWRGQSFKSEHTNLRTNTPGIINFQRSSSVRVEAIVTSFMTERSMLTQAKTKHAINFLATWWQTQKPRKLWHKDWLKHSWCSLRHPSAEPLKIPFTPNLPGGCYTDCSIVWRNPEASVRHPYVTREVHTPAIKKTKNLLTDLHAQSLIKTHESFACSRRLYTRHCHRKCMCLLPFYGSRVYKVEGGGGGGGEIKIREAGKSS